MEDLVLWPGIKPRHLHWKVWSLSHWTTREVPGGSFLKRKLTVKPFLKQASSDLHWLCCYHTRWRWTLSFLFYFILFFLTWTLSLGLAEEAAFLSDVSMGCGCALGCGLPKIWLQTWFYNSSWSPFCATISLGRRFFFSKTGYNSSCLTEMSWELKQIPSVEWVVGGLVPRPCLTLCDTMGCSPPGSSVHGILQARILEWVTVSSSRGSSRPRDWTHVSYISCIRQVGSLPSEPPGKPDLWHHLAENRCSRNKCWPKGRKRR